MTKEELREELLDILDEENKMDLYTEYLFEMSYGMLQFTNLAELVKKDNLSEEEKEYIDLAFVKLMIEKNQELKLNKGIKQYESTVDIIHPKGNIYKGTKWDLNEETGMLTLLREDGKLISMMHKNALGSPVDIGKLKEVVII